MEILNNREIATLVWFAIIIGYVISKKPNISLIPVLQCLLHRKLFSVVLLTVAYIAFILYFLLRSQGWPIELIKESIYWLFGTAIILFFEVRNFNVKRILRNAISITVVIEFFVHFYTFSLLAELILIPILFVLSATSVLAASKAEYSAASKVINAALTIIGAFLFLHAINSLVNEFTQFATMETLKTFSMAPILTFLFIPYLYFLALYSTYDSFFARINWKMEHKDKRLRRYVKFKSFMFFNLKLEKLKRMSPELVKQLASVENKEQVRELIASMRTS